MGRISRVRHRNEINRTFKEVFATKTAEEWYPLLSAERVPYARVNTCLGAFANRQVAHRGMVRDLEHPTSGTIRVVGPPWIINGGRTPMTAPPTLDQHAENVLGDWLGWSEERISAFRAGRAG